MGKNKLIVGDTTYVSSKVAGRSVGLVPDYISRLCRLGLVRGIRLRGVWYINIVSLKTFLQKQAARHSTRFAEQSVFGRRRLEHFQIAHTLEKIGLPIVTNLAPATLRVAHEFRRKRIIKKQKATTIIAGILLCVSLLSILGTQFEGATFAVRTRATLAAASEGLAASTFSQVFCSWFGAWCPKENVMTMAARERISEPIVVYGKTPTPPYLTASAPLENQLPAPTRTIVERVIERVVEATPLAGTYITDTSLASRLSTLEERINGRINNLSYGYSPSASSGGGGSISPIYQTIALTNNIDNLADVTITNPTISGGSITASSLLGIVTNAVNSAAATVTTLTATTLSATNATSTRIDAIEYIAVGGTATTTIRGDNVASTIPYASSTAITVSGTSFLTNLLASASSTIGGTTQASGLTISGGATTTGFLVVQGTAASSTFASGITTNGLRVASNGITVANLTSCTEALETDASGNIICGSDATAAGAANNFAFSINYGVITAATTSPIWAQNGVFASSTSHLAYFDVIGATSTGLSYFTGGLVASASSTVNGALTVTGDSLLRAATTTNLAISNITSTLLKTNATGGVIPAVLGTDYQTFAFPFTTTTNYGSQVANATTTALWLQGTPYSLFASSTATFSAINTVYATSTYASSTALTVSGTSFFTTATTSTLTVSGNTQLANSMTGPLQAIAGLVSASSTLSDFYVSDALTISSAGSVNSTALTDGGTIGFDWIDGEVADALTVSGGTIASNNISGTLTTTGTLTIGDNGDVVAISASNFDVGSSGNVTIDASGSTRALSVTGDEPSGYAADFINNGNNTTRWGIYISAGKDDSTGTNTAIQFDDGDNTSQGAITFSSGTVTYGAFTANHDIILPGADNATGYPYGTLVCTDDIVYKNGMERGIEYKVSMCNTAYEKSVLGAYAGKRDEEANSHLAYVLGDGHIRINGQGGDIAVGDAIATSYIAGIGMRATSTALVIGIAQEAHTFTSPDEEYLIPVQYGLRSYMGDADRAALSTVVALSADFTSMSPTFLTALFQKIAAWLADATNGIGEVFAAAIHAENVYADTGTFKTLCVTKSDGVQICVTGDELEMLLNGSSIAPLTTVLDTAFSEGAMPPPDSDATAPTEEVPVQEPPLETTQEPETQIEPTTEPEEQIVEATPETLENAPIEEPTVEDSIMETSTATSTES